MKSSGIKIGAEELLVRSKLDIPAVDGPPPAQPLSRGEHVVT